VIPDRIEAGTFLIAGAITGGDLTVANCAPDHLGAVVAKLQQAGSHTDILDESTLRVRPAKKLVAADVTTEEYPGFATDMQAQYMPSPPKPKELPSSPKPFSRTATSMPAKWSAWAPTFPRRPPPP